MKVIKGTCIQVTEEEIKDAILSLLYKQKPDLRPAGMSRPNDPTIEFVVGKEGVSAIVEMDEQVQS